MIDSIFSKSTTKEFDRIAKKLASLNDKKEKLADKAIRETDADTIKKVFELIKKYGHPCEKEECIIIEKHYDEGNRLTFDELMTLQTLYQSNYNHFSE